MKVSNKHPEIKLDFDFDCLSAHIQALSHL